jgi:Chaperone of endosialidase
LSEFFFKNFALQFPEKPFWRKHQDNGERLPAFHFTLMKNNIASFVTILLVACLEFSQNSNAVTPAPDGGYPGGNTAEGTDALLSLTTGMYNTAVGLFSLRANKTGDYNTAIGAGALILDTAGENTATGAQALYSNTTGNKNTADGTFALLSNGSGNGNTAIGHSALFHNVSGGGNTANGVNALFSNHHGGSNTANGAGALIGNVGGNFNTADGASALLNNTSGTRNIGLGAGAGANITSASNVICIGTDGANVNNSCYIGQIFNAISSGGTAVFINSNGKLGTVMSSRRFKEEIKPMDQASEVLFALNPVTFRYKKELDQQGIPQFGLVAEDVEKVDPDLVVRDAAGKVNTVRYEAINAMLLNEFLKEHKTLLEQQRKVQEQDRKIQEQETTMAQLKKELETVVAHSKGQDARIQRVSDQVEANSPAAPAVVSNQ